MAFYASERQVEGGDFPEVDTVEVRFRGSNGEHGRKGAVLMRLKSYERKWGRRGGVAAGNVPDTWWKVGSTADGVPGLRGMVGMD